MIITLTESFAIVMYLNFYCGKRGNIIFPSSKKGANLKISSQLLFMDSIMMSGLGLHDVYAHLKDCLSNSAGTLYMHHALFEGKKTSARCLSPLKRHEWQQAEPHHYC